MIRKQSEYFVSSYLFSTFVFFFNQDIIQNNDRSSEDGDRVCRCKGFAAVGLQILLFLLSGWFRFTLQIS